VHVSFSPRCVFRTIDVRLDAFGLGLLSGGLFAETSFTPVSEQEKNYTAASPPSNFPPFTRLGRPYRQYPLPRPYTDLTELYGFNVKGIFGRFRGL